MEVAIPVAPVAIWKREARQALLVTRTREEQSVLEEQEQIPEARVGECSAQVAMEVRGAQSGALSRVKTAATEAVVYPSFV